MRISDCSVCCQIFKQVGDRVALALQRRRRERDARCGLRVDAGRMVDEVGVEAALLDLFGRQVARQLVDDRGDHLLMGELFCTYLRIKMAPRANGCLPSADIPHSTQSVRGRHGLYFSSVHGAPLWPNPPGFLFFPGDYGKLLRQYRTIMISSALCGKFAPGSCAMHQVPYCLQTVWMKWGVASDVMERAL